MSDPSPRDPDPRYDPAFQRGFAGGVDRLRGDDRAFARPQSDRADAPGATAPSRRSLRPPRTPPVSAPPAETRPELPDAGATEEEPAAAPVRAEEPLAPLRTNPWFWALLAAGFVGSLIGVGMLAGAVSAPPTSYGNGSTPETAWVLRQLVYYASVPLMGCLPVALLLALALAAQRWRRPARPLESTDEADPTAAVLFD